MLAAQTRPVRGAPGVGMNGTVAGEMEYSVCIHACTFVFVCDCTCTMHMTLYIKYSTVLSLCDHNMRMCLSACTDFT